MLRISLLSAALFLAVGQVRADSWADALFEEHHRDFGTVPHGQMLTHPFRLTNKTGKTVVISNVRVSCGCTQARALQTSLAPGQETAIMAQMNSGVLYDSRTVTIYVTFSQPEFTEVSLTVKANSRGDVAFSPNSLAFGAIKAGDSPTSSMTVMFLNGSTTKIVDTKCDSNYIQPNVQEIRREGTTAIYQVSATVRADTPAGSWYTDIWLKTSNPSWPLLRVPLTVDVAAGTKTVSVMSVVLSDLKAGSTNERKVVLRAVRPFRITGITGTNGQVTVAPTDNENAAVHVLNLTLRPTEPGEVTHTLRVQTDIANMNEIEFSAKAQVVP